jgi:pimeloyl-ACP methyl ester carboxylesterase
MTSTITTLRGFAGLAFDCFKGLVSVVEEMHETIAGHPLPWSPPPTQLAHARGPIAASVYDIVRGISAGLAGGVDRSVGALAEWWPSSSSPASSSVTILNGICGDHLAATGNPLAIPMTLRSPRHPLELTRAALSGGLAHPTGRIALLVHGLCLSERTWSRHGAPSIGDRLEQHLGYTPIYVRYNTGRHVSTNGRELAHQLQRLIHAWPVPVQSITLVGHSMGGLVARSSCWYAQEAGYGWIDLLENVVCLGTPHHGARLERAGEMLTGLLRANAYLKPLALGQYRSAGIKDLRHGSLLDEDWQHAADGSQVAAAPRPVPLLERVRYFMAAATLGGEVPDPPGVLSGDLLVSTPSALGDHPDERRRLRVPAENRRIFYQMNHFDLLDQPAVHRQILEWLGMHEPLSCFPEETRSRARRASARPTSVVCGERNGDRD